VLRRNPSLPSHLGRATRDRPPTLTAPCSVSQSAASSGHTQNSATAGHNSSSCSARRLAAVGVLRLSASCVTCSWFGRNEPRRPFALRLERAGLVSSLVGHAERGRAAGGCEYGVRASLARPAACPPVRCFPVRACARSSSQFRQAQAARRCTREPRASGRSCRAVGS